MADRDRAAHGVVHVRNGAVAPPSHLVSEQRRVAQRARADRALLNDGLCWSLASHDGRHLNREAIAVDTNLKR
jgi:hypothetical protein